MTAEDAIKKLQSCRYDMVILDVMLPYNIKQESVRTGGVSVLKCITMMDQVKKPLCVLGLTGFDDTLQQSIEEFENASCVLIKYQGDSAGWRNKLKQKLIWLYHAKQALMEEVRRPEEYLYDLAVITVTDVEFQAVYKWEADWKEERSGQDPEIYYTTEIVVNGSKKKVVLVKQKYKGMPVAAALTSKIISCYRPRCVCMTGITSGKKGEVSIGDIIVADESWDYGSGKWMDENGQLRKIRDQWNETAAEEMKQDTRIHLGALTSGAAVIQNPQILQRYIEVHHRKVLGIDMETYGVYYACENAPQPAPQYLSIKAVSDYGDKDKNDRYQKYCACMSARFLYCIAEDLLGLQ